MMVIRGGTALLRVEYGRWRGLNRAERMCGKCDLERVVDEKHWQLE